MDLKNDLEFIYSKIEQFKSEFSNKSIFITGGTGFFGQWIVRSLLYLDSKENLNIKIGLLTRNAKKTLHKVDFFNDNRITLYEGDIKDFEFPKDYFNYIIHGASTSSVDKFNGEKPLERFLILSEGTKRILDFAVSVNVEKFFLISSGGVYGKQPENILEIKENDNTAPSTLDLNSCYGEGKRVSELLSFMYSSEYGFELKIARCFAFVGPYMDFDIHFAVGNFINQALNGEDIVINGTGLQSRTYMYMSDFVVWLINILIKGKNQVPYNVGSDEVVTIKELAQKVKVVTRAESNIKILGTYQNIDTTDRYIPSIDLVKKDLGLEIYTPLDKALLKTSNFRRGTLL